MYSSAFAPPPHVSWLARQGFPATYGFPPLTPTIPNAGLAGYGAPHCGYEMSNPRLIFPPEPPEPPPPPPPGFDVAEVASPRCGGIAAAVPTAVMTRPRASTDARRRRGIPETSTSRGASQLGDCPGTLLQV